MLSQEIISAILRNYRGINLRISEIENLTKVLGYPPSGEIFYIPDELANILSFSSSTTELDKLKKVITLIDYMVESLDDKLKETIKCLYVAGNTYDRASDLLDISRATVSNRRLKAIDAMSKMV